ncbi:LytR C-terminal domain-containing protein [Nocardioides cynanchi]|uniref:LytR C-terminal domain-containing protein n=1 Tax=Nocardioides cynanchi TaxID=2558918 RepID=UPI001786C68D|nr:LytR C-terminal domain-containing protein [Nocardioides cynanchi]
MNLTQHVKTLLTLAVLAVLVLVGVTWGWASLTSPFPHRAAAQGPCVTTTLQPGDRVSAPKLIVSVFNASNRVGLAESTMSQFEAQGFGAGDVGNAPQGTSVQFAQVWSTDPRDPAVRLVLSRLGRLAHVIKRTHSGPGVIVVVGTRFQKLVPGLSSVKVTTPTTICSPPAS